MTVALPPPAPRIPPPPSPAPLAPASPIASGISASFLQRDAIELARRIVAKIDSPLQLAVDMGLTETQWAVLQHSAHFKSLLAVAQSEANSAAGLQDRVRLKALMALDAGSILDLAGIVNNTTLPVGGRVNAANTLVDIAGLAKQKDQQAAMAGSGPLVVIHMNPASPPVEIGGRIIEHE
jgi:hypothetical protein